MSDQDPQPGTSEEHESFVPSSRQQRSQATRGEKAKFLLKKKEFLFCLIGLAFMIVGLIFFIAAMIRYKDNDCSQDDPMTYIDPTPGSKIQ